jgi:hypothetical protein
MYGYISHKMDLKNVSSTTIGVKVSIFLRNEKIIGYRIISPFEQVVFINLKKMSRLMVKPKCLH